MTETTCPLCNRPTSAGLCVRCDSRIHRQLDDLIEYWVGAHAELLPGRSGSGGRSSERTIGLNVQALSFIGGHDILNLLHEWEKLIREERNLTRPAFLKKPASLEAEIREAVTFAQTHLPWSGEQPWIDDFARELRELHSQGMAAARQFVDKVRKIPCPAETGDGACGNLLKINAEEPLDIFECRLCHSEWTTLRLMAVAMSSSAEIWLDAEALAKWMGISERHVRRLAQRHRLPKRGELYEVHAMMQAARVHA